MKKIFLTTMALLTIASASVFGMYGVDTDWINFLTHGNQFRARLDQLGFTLGNDTIKGTFGFDNNNNFGYGTYGAMLSSTSGTTTTGTTISEGFFYNFNPTISMGLGYTSSVISVGVGYNATIGQSYNRYNNKTEPKKVQAVAHTPVLVLNALDNAFRMAIPIQVVHLTDKFDGLGKGSVTAVSVDSQFRYYTGLDFLPQIRLYLRYGIYGYDYTPEGGTKDGGKFAESFGFDFRLYFGAMVEEVALQPFVKLTYDGALGKQHNQTRVQAASLISGDNGAAVNNPASLLGDATGPAYTASWEKSAWKLTLMPALGLTANSDIVSLYLEPSIGLSVNQKGSTTDKKNKEVYGLAYDVYAEIYITPIKNLEWYFEASIGNTASYDSSTSTTSSVKALSFAGTTGITWYLPQL